MKRQSKVSYWLAAAAAVLGCLDTANAQTNAFTAAPTALTFNTTPGISPLPQTLAIGSTQSAVAFAFNTTGAGCQYLTFQPLGNLIATPTTPAQVAVSASAIGTAGTYTCTITVSGTGVPNLQVPVTINVGTGGGGNGPLTPSPATLALSAQTGSTPVTQTVTLTNTNPATPIAYTAAVTSTPAGWLSITPTSGTVNTTAVLQVQANPAGLAAGTYSGSISVTPAGQPAYQIPVTLNVSAFPTLQVQQGSATVGVVSFSWQTGTALPGPQTLSVTSSSATQNVPFTLAVQGGASFLVVSPTGNLTTPSTVVLSIASSAQALPPGIYSATLTFTSPSAANATVTIPVNFQVSATPLLTSTGPALAAFNYSLGGTVPSPQTITVGTTSTAVPISVVTTVPTGQNWLLASTTATSASAASPATITLTVNPAGLAPGTYSGSVAVTSNGAGNSPLTFPVTLNVSNSTLLSAAPSAITLSYQAGGAVPGPQLLSITSGGTPVNFNVDVKTTSCGSTWLAVNQTTGNTGTAGAILQVTANPSGITPPQACSGSLVISSPGANNTITIPVTLLIGSQNLLSINPSAIALTATIGSTTQPSTTLSLTSTDLVTPVQFLIVNSARWLSITPNTGTTPANVTFRADPTDPSLTLGTNTAIVSITSPSLPNGVVLTLPVTLTLNSSATVSLTPATLSFTQPSGGSAPAPQNVQIAISGGAGVNAFTATATTQFGNWLTVTPASGAVPGSISVSVNGGTLSPGTYNGQVVVSVPGASNTPQTIPVTLTVSQPQSIALSAPAVSFTSQVGASQPPSNQTLQVTSTGGPVQVTVGTTTTTCPGFFTATPTTATTPATITVSVAQSALTTAGTCSGTITVSAPGLAAQTATVSLTVSPAAAPAVTTIVNGASFVPGPIAPGEIVTLFGSNLGPTTLATYVLNSDGTFSTRVAETEVLFDGQPAPILFVRNDQVAVVVPFQVAGRVQTNIQVRRSGQLSNTLQQRVADTAPGIFTIPSTGSGQGAIVNQNGTVNSASAPATKGSVVAIFITGAGQTNPPGSTGGINGTNPLNRIAASVSVTIGGLPADIQYAGGAPFNIQGLYQINVLVPQTQGANPQTVEVKVGGQPTQGSVTMFVQ